MPASLRHQAQSFPALPVTCFPSIVTLISAILKHPLRIFRQRKSLISVVQDRILTAAGFLGACFSSQPCSTSLKQVTLSLTGIELSGGGAVPLLFQGHVFCRDLRPNTSSNLAFSAKILSIEMALFCLSIASITEAGPVTMSPPA